MEIVTRAARDHLGIHLLDKAERGVGHEQREDNPEVDGAPALEDQREQAGDLNLRDTCRGIMD